MHQDLVVDIRSEGKGAPLWILHPIGGAVLFARRLAQLLSADRPILGLQAQGLDGRLPPIASVMEQAEVYAAAIVARQPEGPYLLAGPSFGGYLALEVSRLLTKAGREVAFTGLFDAYGPGYPRKLRGLAYYWSKLRAFFVAPLAQKKLLLRRAMSRSPMLKGVLRYEPGVALNLLHRNTAEPISQVILANLEAVQKYRPERYSGHLHLFHATRIPRNWPGYVFDAPDNGWGPYAEGGVSVIQIDGDHQTLMDDPSVKQLSRELERAINEVLTEDQNSDDQPSSVAS